MTSIMNRAELLTTLTISYSSEFGLQIERVYTTSMSNPQNINDYLSGRWAPCSRNAIRPMDWAKFQGQSMGMHLNTNHQSFQGEVS